MQIPKCIETKRFLAMKLGSSSSKDFHFVVGSHRGGGEEGGGAGHR
jgi:hypothetical protein